MPVHLLADRLRALRRRLRHLPAAALLLAAATAGAIVPDAPVINFRLPIFNEEGYRVWDLHGQQGIYRSRQQIDILGMTIREYTAAVEARVETEIQSSEATFLLEFGHVFGNTPIRITSEAYEITGARWFCDLPNKSVSIQENVRVVFHDAMISILR